MLTFIAGTPRNRFCTVFVFEDDSRPNALRSFVVVEFELVGGASSALFRATAGRGTNERR